MNGQKQGSDCSHFVPGILIPLDVSRGHTQALHCKPMRCQTLTVQTCSPLFGELSTAPIFGELSRVSGSFFQWYKLSSSVCQTLMAAAMACPKLLILLVLCMALLQHGDSMPSRSRKAAPGRQRGNTHHTVEVGQPHFQG